MERVHHASRPPDAHRMNCPSDESHVARTQVTNRQWRRSAVPPRRVSHGENTGSSPVGVTSTINNLAVLALRGSATYCKLTAKPWQDLSGCARTPVRSLGVRDGWRPCASCRDSQRWRPPREWSMSLLRSISDERSDARFRCGVGRRRGLSVTWTRFAYELEIPRNSARLSMGTRVIVPTLIVRISPALISS